MIFDIKAARAVDTDALAASDWGELRARYRAAIAEIERLGEIINNPVEEADWVSDRVLLEGINESFIGTMARKWHAAYRKAQNSNLVRQKEKEFLLEEHAKACEMASKNRCLSKQQAAQIKELEATLAEIRKCAGTLTGPHDMSHYLAEQRIAKIIELEAARIKELDGMLDARSKEIVGRIQECQACQIDQLRAEGKIGPEDAKPRSWQITEERKAALETAEFAVSHLAGCYPDCERILGKPDQRVAKVLRAMLEAGQ